ncbi:MAG: right-handed parallel beta-helix repeat-containing protein [Gemmatimonadales bacterium]
MSARLLIVALIVFAAVANTASAQTITVRPAGDLSSLVGVPFDVPIVADWNGRPDRLGSFALTLRWNPAVLRFESGGPGSFGSIQANTDSVATGVLRLAGANPAGVTGIVTLGVGRFTPLSAGVTPVSLSLNDIYASAPDFSDVSGSTGALSGLYCPARGHWGDPDGDGTVGSRDALIALSEAVGLDVSAIPEHGLADVDGDAAVKARDALIILSLAVGLDVSAYRVSRIAVGSCGSEQTTVYAVTPTGDTVMAQDESQIQFELRATASGAVRALPDVFWHTSDPAVLVVFPDGRGLAVGAGSAVVTAKSGERDSATATIVVTNRRSRHYVDARAISATNQLGTLAHPYANLDQAAQVASRHDGDTVLVQAGRYEQAAFDSGVVILGTRSGSARPLLLGDATSGVALTFKGGTRSEVHDLQIDGVGTGLAAIGVDTLVVDSLGYYEGAGGCGNTAIAALDIVQLTIRHSTLIGAGQYQGCADGIMLAGNARTVVVDASEIGDFSGYPLYVTGGDSVVVRGSVLHDNYNGIEAYAAAGGSLALVVDSSRLLRNYYPGVAASDLRLGLVSHSVIDMVDYDNALDLSGTAASTGVIRLVADSIRVGGYDWLDAVALDSAVVDSMRVTALDGSYYGGGSFYDVDLVRVTTSSFSQMNPYGTIIDVAPNYYTPGPTRLVVDSVTMTGASSCSQCTDGISTTGTTVTAARIRADNLDYGIYVADSGLTVTSSSFTNVYQGIYTYSVAAPTVILNGVTMVNAYYGIESYNATTIIDNAALSGASAGYEGIFTYGAGADTVRNSTVTDYDYSIDAEGSSAYLANNILLRPRSAGIYLSGSGTLTDSAVVMNNSVTCDAAGAASADAIDAYSANQRIAGNTVAGCTSGIYVESGLPGLAATVRGNTVAMSGNATYPGIQVGAPYRAEVVGNVITGGAPYAGGSIYLRGNAYARLPFARVDSNIVRLGQVWGIRTESVDSLGVRGNLVEDVAAGPCCNANSGGITFDGNAAYTARVVANTLRRMHGASAIGISQLDTALVFVDSNAVSESDSAALLLGAGALSMAANNITSNARYGVLISGYSAVPHQIHGNAFQGNQLYAVASANDAITDATGNWWGVDGAFPGTAGADSVYGPVSDTAPLAAKPGVPAPTPPMPMPLLTSVSVTPIVAGASPSTMPVVRAAPPLRVAPMRVQPSAGRLARAGMPHLTRRRADGGKAAAIAAQARQREIHEQTRAAAARARADTRQQRRARSTP